VQPKGSATVVSRLVDAPSDLRLGRGFHRDGESHRDLWLDWLERERKFFEVDGTRSRGDLLVDGNPRQEHDADADADAEIVLLDS
jgi:hypothetical protein